MTRHFAICPRGLEAALADELASLGAAAIATAAGGVAFDADTRVAYAINLWSRLASRVLRQVGQARYRNDDDLYKLAARTPWETWIGPRHTLRVDVNAHRAAVRSLNFATLRIKDGIVDRLRQRDGERPSIDTRTPDVRVFGFLDERLLTLYVDLSGEPLFKRGWRDAGAHADDGDVKGAAPLKEHLAAGLLALSGWTPDVPLYDPFCGSGTILVEAAQRALGLAPGHARHFGFEVLRDFDAATWQSVRGQPSPVAHEPPQSTAAVPSALPAANGAAPAVLRLAGSDIDADAIAQTRRNLMRAGLTDAQAASVRTRQVDFADAPPPFDEPGIVLCNPPYGERLAVRGPAPGARRPGSGGFGGSGGFSGSGAARDPGRGAGARVRDARPAGDDMARFADHLKRHYRGWKICMLTADLSLPRQLGLKERRKTPLFNGPLECRLFVFEIYAEADAR
ncbi:MAG: THUMP domain-containing protein [Burkholderiaceae bacterium]